ncbi:MAG: hypothetical protein WB586_04710 [Chthoniobacterales bacterium]
MRKLGIVSVVELVRLVRDKFDLEDPIQSALENARRLLLAISGSELRGARHVWVAIRQITKAIEMNSAAPRFSVEAARMNNSEKKRETAKAGTKLAAALLCCPVAPRSSGYFRGLS